MASRAQGAQTREAIVRVAMRCFAERGFRRTSLDTVAAAAGVSRQGLLYYFPSKAALLLAAVEQHDEDDRLFAAGLAQGDELHLVEAVTGVVRRHQEDPAIGQLSATFLAEGSQPDNPAHDFFRERHERIRGMLLQLVAAEQEEGRITRTVDAGLLTDTLQALLSGLSLHRILQPRADTLAILDVFLQMVAGEDAGADDPAAAASKAS